MTDLTSVQIQALVREMDASMRKYRLTKRVNPEKYHELVAYENQTLYEMFPSVFEMHIEGKLDATFFEMLKLKHKMDKKELTEDEASRIIGQKLFDRFVAPVIDKKPVEKPLSYSEFYKQFSDK
jgi:hypothetical protein